MTTILRTRDLSKVYGTTRALSEVSVKIRQGEIYGLIGRNGAGKTSFLKILAGLTRQSSGSYEIFGERDDQMALARPRIGCLIEATGMYPNLSALEHLKLKSLAMGLPPSDDCARLLERVGLGSVGRKAVKNFSLGMKQRLGIALALLGSPDLILLDEPVNGLDPQGIVEIRELIREINEEEKVTFIISSHILDELQRLATRFGIIEEGKLLDEIDQEALRELSQHRIELGTPDPGRAVTLLDELGIHDYKVVSDQMIYIFEGLHLTGKIAVALARNDVPIDSIHFNQSSLEDYYLSLTSGFTRQDSLGPKSAADSLHNGKRPMHSETSAMDIIDGASAASATHDTTATQNTEDSQTVGED